MNNNLERWRQVVFENDMEMIKSILTEDVEFHSPAQMYDF